MGSILNNAKLQPVSIGFGIGSGLKMNFQHQIAKSSNNPPLGLSKAASKYDAEALAEFNFRAGTKTKKGVLVAAIHGSIQSQRFSQDRANSIKT